MSFALFRTVWSYREFILGNIKRELQVKYKNSLLGAAWTIINPLAMIIVYTVIFSRVMHARLPGVDHSFAYSIYLCSGVLTWGLFTEIVGRSQNVFIENANIIKKINFPKLCLPAIVIGNALLNFTFIFGLFTLFLICTHNFPGITYFALLPVLLILVLFSIGLGIILGVANVFFRDVGQFFSIVLQFWFWFTPIVYPLSILPEEVQHYLSFNPMMGVMQGFHSILVDGDWPNWQQLLPATISGFILVWLGFRLFRKRSGEMVDEL